MFSNHTNKRKKPLCIIYHLKKRNFNHFSLAERKLIEKLNRNGFSANAIANLLGKHRSSVSRQLNNKSNTDFVKIGSKVKHLYVANKAHSNYLKNKSNCGAEDTFQKTKILIQ